MRDHVEHNRSIMLRTRPDKKKKDHRKVAKGTASSVRAACPPENVGGVRGYAELQETLRNPKHEEYESLREWVGPGFDPTSFDLKKVNAFLRIMAFPIPVSAFPVKGLKSSEGYEDRIFISRACSPGRENRGLQHDLDKGKHHGRWEDDPLTLAEKHGLTSLSCLFPTSS
ncbi:MAG: hypothetical protein WCQ16_01090 [Verrucomicrobiae bacterium]